MSTSTAEVFSNYYCYSYGESTTTSVPAAHTRTHCCWSCHCRRARGAWSCHVFFASEAANWAGRGGEGAGIRGEYKLQDAPLTCTST